MEKFGGKAFIWLPVYKALKPKTSDLLGMKPANTHTQVVVEIWARFRKLKFPAVAVLARELES